MEDKIINIVSEVCEDESIKDNADVDLIDSGLLDSVTFINLIAMLENEFNIEIQPTQVAQKNWRTTRSIIELIKRLI